MGGGRRDLEEGHLGDTLPRRRAGAQARARARSEPPPSTPPPAAPLQAPVWPVGTPTCLCGSPPRGGAPASPRLPGRGRRRGCTRNGFWVRGAQRGFLQGEAASPRGGGLPPFLPSEKRQVPESPVGLPSRKLAAKQKSVSGERRTHTFALTLLETLPGSVSGTLASSSVPPTQSGERRPEQEAGAAAPGPGNEERRSGEGRRAWPPVGLESPGSSLDGLGRGAGTHSCSRFQI